MTGYVAVNTGISAHRKDGIEDSGVARESANHDDEKIISLAIDSDMAYTIICHSRGLSLGREG
jgi:hypothetical protein